MVLRSLAVLLVCLNLGAAAWWWLHTPRAQLADSATADGSVPRLLLLSEREQEPLQPAVTAIGHCLSLGPFEAPEQLRDAMRRLTPLVERIQMRELPSARLLGYRVFLPAAANHEAALQRASQLAARGVRDYYLVTAGAQQNTIALGLFRELANAERRHAELKALGFAVVLEPRQEDALQWWIDLVAAPDFDWQAALGSDAADTVQASACPGTQTPEAADQGMPAVPDVPSGQPTR